ncbi:MAG: hypothetical protein A2289_00555 [Deltaproteobacteria bacterium RIFOXYA12_FULL_58_15]|nr:MAG: hypothetical protein A2289_00555 [Deltaproteobacteria bacterium RIFOXYA12_FULL_58_15]OGR12563.1 MAG: hypothetical protein A2341_00445 [Deltaproteobacteria bacterium RIFOXYB12_FULL_58_9]
MFENRRRNQLWWSLPVGLLLRPLGVTLFMVSTHRGQHSAGRSSAVAKNQTPILENGEPCLCDDNRWLADRDLGFLGNKRDFISNL